MKLTDREKRRVAAQARQDQHWMSHDEWFTESEPADLIDLISAIDVEPQDGLMAMMGLSDIQLEIVRCATLHWMQELVLRQQRRLAESV